jgi:hypothetical protein
MWLEVDACDLGLSRQSGRCAIDTRAPGAGGAPLSSLQRLTPAVAGFVFHAVGLALSRRPVRPIAAIAHWFGASHLVASATAYPGCPELGAIPSVVAGRPLVTDCGPWEAIDRRLGLRD